jgi:hypothetical protein
MRVTLRDNNSIQCLKSATGHYTGGANRAAPDSTRHGRANARSAAPYWSHGITAYIHGGSRLALHFRVLRSGENDRRGDAWAETLRETFRHPFARSRGVAGIQDSAGKTRRCLDCGLKPAATELRVKTRSYLTAG